MSGFPTRPSLSAFGPTLKNRAGVRDPERDAGAALLNLMRWQLAGVGVTSELAWALLTWDSGTSSLSLGSSQEAWDASAAVLPTVSRTSAGVYVVQYAATHVDMDAQTIATNLLAVVTHPQTTLDRRAVGQVRSDKRTIDVTVRDAAGAAADASVLVVAW